MAKTKTPKIGFKKSLKEHYTSAKQKAWSKKSTKRYHKSFKRSYREDYVRDLEMPGLLHHAFNSFGTFFKNWRLFLPLIAVVTVLNIFLVGLMSETSYVQFQEILEQTNQELADGKLGNFAKAGLLLVSTITTGGLNQSMSEVQILFMILLAITIWLVTIFIVRHKMAGHKVKLRDALYNAMTPFISTICVLTIVFIQCIPIFILIIVYSTAVTTGFLNYPFYALLFFIFASLMIILSGYLLSSSIIALVAISAPGLYPMQAIHNASELMAGRRVRFVIRILFLIFIILMTYVFVMIPVILLDLWLKATFASLAGVAIVPFVFALVTCFAMIYASIYLYLYYRRMLEYDNQE